MPRSDTIFRVTSGAFGRLKFHNVPDELLDFKDPDGRLKKASRNLHIYPRYIGAQPWDTDIDLLNKLRWYVNGLKQS